MSAATATDGKVTKRLLTAAEAAENSCGGQLSSISSANESGSAFPPPEFICAVGRILASAAMTVDGEGAAVCCQKALNRRKEKGRLRVSIQWPDPPRGPSLN